MREERTIQILEQRQCCRECVVENCTCTECDEAFEMSIKAIKQESVLDKIRAEMLEEMLSHSGTGEEVIQAYADGLKKGVDILDKFKAESEGI